jgi:hypothetical protein
MPPGNSAQLGRHQIPTERNSVVRAVRLGTLDPKSRAINARTGQCCRWVYTSINDLATCERIHKIGVLPPQCSAVRRPTQSLTPAVDLQSSTRPPSLTSEMFAEDRSCGALRIGQQKTGRQMGSKNSILRKQVFILQQKLLIQHPGHVR